MWCACRPDAGLYYKISEDLKIYPEHNGYTHDRYCCRYKNLTGSEQQKPPYYVGEDGDVTVFTSFDSRQYSRNIDNSEKDHQYTMAPDEGSAESEDILIDKDNNGCSTRYNTLDKAWIRLKGVCIWKSGFSAIF